MFKLFYKKKFVKGILEGIELDENLTFSSQESANNWIQGVRKNISKNKLDYVLENIETQIV